MKLLHFFLILLTFYSCQSPSDKTLQEFKKVDSSLQANNRLISNADSVAFYYYSIKDKNTTNPAADTIYRSLQYTIALLQRTKDLLKEKDSAGTNPQLAAKILIKTPLGDSIRSAVIQLWRQCQQTLTDKNEQTQLNKIIAPIQEFDRRWTDMFKDTPTVGALTLLSYLDLQCNKAVILTLKDLNQRP